MFTYVNPFAAGMLVYNLKSFGNFVSLNMSFTVADINTQVPN